MTDSSNSAGYDMVLAISQNEVNSQFYRLFKNGFIKSLLEPNHLANSGGPFGEGPMELSSYLRGYIGPPQVTFASGHEADEVLFRFGLACTPVTAHKLGVTQEQLDNAFKDPNNPNDGLLVKLEDIPYHGDKDSQETLAEQEINYWVSKAKVGATQQYFLVPALYYTVKVDSEHIKLLVSLDGLELSFQVLLDSMPTTSAEIQKLVDDKKAPAELLQAIDQHGFNQDLFALEQLFLDFSDTNFNHWELKDPATALQNISGMTINDDGTFTVATKTSDEFEADDQSFSTEMSLNLENAFGLGKTNAGSTPYIIGINASSTNPSQSNPSQPPSLVPTYVSYSTTPNQTVQDLATINYQILGGNKPESRVPKTADGNTINVSTSLVTSNDYSGTLIFSRGVFFEPFVLAKLHAAIGGDWPQENPYHFSSESTETAKNDNTFLGIGTEGNLTSTTVTQAGISVAGDTITASGKLSYTIKTTIVASTPVENLGTFEWTNTGSLDWSNEWQLQADAAGRLTTANTGGFQGLVTGQSESFEASLIDAAEDAYNAIAGPFLGKLPDTTTNQANAISQSLEAAARQLDQGLITGMSSNFISPTGTVFLLNEPKFNDDLDLVMDVTYDV